jgi:hypothetical protein
LPQHVAFNIITAEREGKMEWMAELRAALGNEADIFFEREPQIKDKSYEIRNNTNKNLKFEIIIKNNTLGYQIVISQNTTPSSI